MIDNPYLDPSYTKRLADLPDDHPAKLKGKLTTLQSFAFPILLWFFDGRRNLGTGRSYLMAHILIELAMRGDAVYINDLSIWPLHGKSDRERNNFMHVLMDILKTEYKGHRFEIRNTSYELIYKGRD